MFFFYRRGFDKGLLGGGGDEPRQPLRDQNALVRLYIVLSFLGAGRETVKICTGNGIKIKINDPSQLAPAKAGSRDAGCGMADEHEIIIQNWDGGDEDK